MDAVEKDEAELKDDLSDEKVGNRENEPDGTEIDGNGFDEPGLDVMDSEEDEIDGTGFDESGSDETESE